MSDSRLQEIVTRAVVGRAERRMCWKHTVPAEGVTGVFGVHVTDAAVAVKESDGRPVVDLIVDCDLWCGTAKNTKVLRCTCRNTESVDIRKVGQVLGESVLNVRALGPARATGVDAGDGQITVALEADVLVEMSALARMWVKAYSLEDDVLGDLDDPDSSSSGSGSSSDSTSGSSSGEDYSGGEE